MLTTVFSLHLFLALILSCHLFSNILPSMICARTCYNNTAQNKASLRTFKRTFRSLRCMSPSQLPVEFGWPPARINANWNTYLVIFMTFDLVCNKYLRYFMILLLLFTIVVILFIARFISSRDILEILSH